MVSEGGAETYEGEFLNGVRHGRGTCFHANGECYVGEWKDGERQGAGQPRAGASLWC